MEQEGGHILWLSLTTIPHCKLKKRWIFFGDYDLLNSDMAWMIWLDSVLQPWNKCLSLRDKLTLRMISINVCLILMQKSICKAILAYYKQHANHIKCLSDSTLDGKLLSPRANICHYLFHPVPLWVKIILPVIRNISALVF